MDKRVASADAAIANLQDGMTVLMGGFGLCGIPENLISARRAHARGVGRRAKVHLHRQIGKVGPDDA
jgi:acyl-CoA hydrolase